MLPGSAQADDSWTSTVRIAKYTAYLASQSAQGDTQAEETAQGFAALSKADKARFLDLIEDHAVMRKVFDPAEAPSALVGSSQQVLAAWRRRGAARVPQRRRRGLAPHLRGAQGLRLPGHVGLVLDHRQGHGCQGLAGHGADQLPGEGQGHREGVPGQCDPFPFRAGMLFLPQPGEGMDFLCSRPTMPRARPFGRHRAGAANGTSGSGSGPTTAASWAVT